MKGLKSRFGSRLGFVVLSALLFMSLVTVVTYAIDISGTDATGTDTTVADAAAAEVAADAGDQSAILGGSEDGAVPPAEGTSDQDRVRLMAQFTARIRQMTASLGESGIAVSAEVEARLMASVSTALQNGVSPSILDDMLTNIESAALNGIGFDQMVDIVETEAQMAGSRKAYIGVSAVLGSLDDYAVEPSAVAEVAAAVQRQVGDRWGEGAYRGLLSDVMEIVLGSVQGADASEEDVATLMAALETVMSADDNAVNIPRINEVARLLVAAQADGKDVTALAEELVPAIQANGSVEQAVESVESRYGLAIDEVKERVRERAENRVRNEEQSQRGQSNAQTGQSNAQTGQSNAQTGQSNAQTGQSNAQTGQSNAQAGQSDAQAGQSNVQPGESNGNKLGNREMVRDQEMIQDQEMVQDQGGSLVDQDDEDLVGDDDTASPPESDSPSLGESNLDTGGSSNGNGNPGGKRK